MNVFGGATRAIDKGPRGPRGFKGKDSSIDDFCTWLPNTLVNNLQVNDETGAFFIENLEKDIVRKAEGKEITEWISRSKRRGNLIAKKPSSEIEKIEEFFRDSRYAMNFKTAHYHALQSPFLGGLKGTCGFICITFRTNSDSAEQVLMSNPTRHHPPTTEYEIKVSATEIIIQTRSNDTKKIIQHPCKEWTTLFIEYNSDDHLSHYTYDVNGTIGSFTSPSLEREHTGFHLGCRWDETCHLDGQIASVETYVNENTAAPLPDTVKNIVINNQRIQ